MRLTKQKYRKPLQKTMSTILVLALLLGTCPWAFAVEAEEAPPAGAQVEEEWEEAPETPPEELPPAEEEPEEEPAVLSDTIVTYPVTGGNIYFDTATGTITDCDTSVTEAIIPETIQGVSVTGIGDQAFWKCSRLVDVTIPDSVVYIGGKAFVRCDSLTSIDIPDSVTSIGTGAFTYQNKLKAINVDPLNKVYCSIDGVLFNKAATTLIQYPGVSSGVFNCYYTIPDTVTAIGDSAFADC